MRRSRLKGEFTTENLKQTLGFLPGAVAALNTQFSYKANKKTYQKPQSKKKKKEKSQPSSLSEVINTQRIDVSALSFE